MDGVPFLFGRFRLEDPQVVVKYARFRPQDSRLKVRYRALMTFANDMEIVERWKGCQFLGGEFERG